MLIKDMFEKDIDRDIQGVIKVGQESEAEVYNELDEYVVTKELQKHFRDFFSSYKKGILGETDKMGVWISGFFGSGKSHFLKILSYLLENKEAKGRKALDFFVEDEKIVAPMVIADMELAANQPTDVILFNIDSKSDTSGVKSKDSILNVFLKVFNEMQGYSMKPHLANLERHLDNEGLYDKFKDRYQEINNESWIDSRNAFNFYMSRVEKVLVDIGFMSQDDARLWTESTVRDHELSIGDFARLVNEYIETKDDNHHVVFLVDEVGQYVGDDNDLMLNLQTITEDLGRICGGKAWVIVTSQQDIDSMTEVRGDDFSKIQGRFDTRLSLTSSNVDEVIKLRILQKNEVATESLKIEYETKETIIKNLIIFNDAVEKKKYRNAKDFAEDYPFIPYQADILALVLTSIRRHGASGKHLSEGERSMLALYKQSAEELKNKEMGELVPFNLFYDALERFLDHSHSKVIIGASSNSKINPNNKEECFSVNVLKTLFMIKYVEQVEPNIDNITTLMVSNINQDRRELREQVQGALNVLVHQMLVQKHADKYIFLTDEEQEINREIEKQVIEESELIQDIQEMIYSDILTDDKISLTRFKNKYNFDFDKFVDDVPFKSKKGTNLRVNIVTPSNSNHNNIPSLAAMSLHQVGTVIVNMSDDSSFIDEIRTGLKVQKFLRQSHSRDLPGMDDIISKKRKDMQENTQRAKFLIGENLKDATYFVNNNEIKSKSSDFKTNVLENLENVAKEVYNKLSYIDKPMDEGDIRKLLSDEKNRQMSASEDHVYNKLAIDEVMNYINIKSRTYSVTMKDLLNQFKKQPFGYTQSDIQWLVTYLYVEGKISLNFSGERLNRRTQNIQTLINYICKVRNADKLLINKTVIHPDEEKQSFKKVSTELFNRQVSMNDVEKNVEEFKMDANNLLRSIQSLKTSSEENNYPGIEKLGEIGGLLKDIESMNQPKDILNYVHTKKDVFLKAVEDYEQVTGFYYGSQKRHWDESNKNRIIFENEKLFLHSTELKEIFGSITEIFNMTNPYGKLSQLPQLNSQFETVYTEILVAEKKPVYNTLKDSKKELINKAVQSLDDPKEFTEKVDKEFKELENEIKFSQLVKDVRSLETPIKVKTTQLFDTLNKYVNKDEISLGDKSYDEEEEKRTRKPAYRQISLKQLSGTSSKTFSNKQEIEKYLGTLQELLENELNNAENIIINL